MPDEEISSDKHRLLGFLREIYRRKVLENFEGLFVFSTFVLIVFILYICDQKLAFLNFYFVPVLLAGYFMNTRSAVLGSLLSILVVSFFAVLRPDSFYQELDTMGIYLHLVTWGAFLILTGVLVGRMNEELRERFARARRTLAELNELQAAQAKSNRRLEEKNLDLETMKTKVEAVLHYTMDPVVAKLVINRQLRNEKREITVLFADLENFTTHMEAMPPEVAVGDLNRLFTAMEPILTMFRGHLDKYIGDGLMAEFGVPYFSERHPVLAVLAGLRMQARMERKDFPWKMRIGIANGPALVGLMGSDHRKNYTALGDTVNLASRLQALCPAGGVTINQTTHEQIRRWFHTRRVRLGISVKEAEELEEKLGAVVELNRARPDPARCLEAASLCSRLGEPERALEFQRQALLLRPDDPAAVRDCVAQEVRSHEDRALLAIKGKKQRVAAFEVLGLKDPIDDRERVPAPVAAVYRRLSAGMSLPSDVLLPLEALEGSIGHSAATAAFSSALAEAMGLPEAAQREALLAGYLHDIGKRGMPEHLLGGNRRMEELSAADQETVRSHTTQAGRMLEDLGIPVSESVLAAVRQHHERFAGGGYPEGLRGQDISLLARIIQLADEYEALTAWRPHREAWAPGAARGELARDMAEGKFDPKIGEVFLKMLGTDKWD